MIPSPSIDNPRSYPEEDIWVQLKLALRQLYRIFAKLLGRLTSLVSDSFDRPVSSPAVELRKLRDRKNFASKDSGSTIIWRSEGITNPKSILSANKEEYLILPDCKEHKEYALIVNLSEDVLVDTIVITNNEDFSDVLGSIHFEGSIDYPPEHQWIDVGELRPAVNQHEHVLNVELDKS